MAFIPERPDTFFRVSPAELSKAQCFAVKRGEINQRLNVAFYRGEYTQFLHSLRKHYPDIRPLGSYGEIVCGPFGTTIKQGDYVADGVPLLRISNITDQGNLDIQGVVFITPGKSEELASTRVTEGDLVISQRGTLGMSAVVSSEFPAFNISANLIAIRGLSGLLSRFVQLYLSSRLGERQVSRLQSGQVHAKITTIDVASILIPNVSNQIELIHAMDTARAERKKKLADADAILASIDDVLRDALGLTPPSDDPRRVFAVRLAQPRAQGRLNSDYYHPERILALRTLSAAENLMVARLAEVVSFRRNQIKMPSKNYLSLAHVQSHTGELTDATNTASGTCFTYQANDVLFARLRPYLNKVYRAEMNGCCSTEFHVLRAKDPKLLLSDYLSSVLRSRLVLAQTVHMMTGNTHPRLTNDDVANLKIPIPGAEVQETIAAEARRLRLEARRLRTEAEAGWVAAKRWFEDQLLGAATQ